VKKDGQLHLSLCPNITSKCKQDDLSCKLSSVDLVCDPAAVRLFFYWLHQLYAHVIVCRLTWTWFYPGWLVNQFRLDRANY